MNNEFKKRIQMLREQDEEMLKKYGWIVHYVFPAKEGELANIHTHGVEENFNHKDFQIVLPLPQQLVHSLLVSVVERVKRGERFEPQKPYSNIIANYNVYFVEKYEGDRLVLRMIFPDEQGKYPWDSGCEPYYCDQVNFETRY